MCERACVRLCVHFCLFMCVYARACVRAQPHSQEQKDRRRQTNKRENKSVLICKVVDVAVFIHKKTSSILTYPRQQQQQQKPGCETQQTVLTANTSSYTSETAASQEQIAGKTAIPLLKWPSRCNSPSTPTARVSLLTGRWNRLRCPSQVRYRCAIADFLCWLREG